MLSSSLVGYDDQVIWWTAAIRNCLEHFMDNDIIFSVEKIHYGRTAAVMSVFIIKVK